jgi:hypothetical protein
MENKGDSAIETLPRVSEAHGKTRRLCQLQGVHKVRHDVCDLHHNFRCVSPNPESQSDITVTHRGVVMFPDKGANPNVFKKGMYGLVTKVTSLCCTHLPSPYLPSGGKDVPDFKVDALHWFSWRVRWSEVCLVLNKYWP